MSGPTPPTQGTVRYPFGATLEWILAPVVSGVLCLGLGIASFAGAGTVGAGVVFTAIGAVLAAVAVAVARSYRSGAYLVSPGQPQLIRRGKDGAMHPGPGATVARPDIAWVEQVSAVGRFHDRFRS